MFNKLILLLLVFLTVSFSFVDPKYDGLIDFRYIKSKNGHKGSGSFSIHDIQLNVKLPINKNYIILYETHLTGNIEQFQQLYLDVDGFGLPMNIKLGRFRIPFSSEKITQKDKYFVSNTVLKDAVWGNGSYLIPREENGMDLYYHSRVFSADMYLVNGNGVMTETNNDKAGKSYGVDLRFLAKDVIDVGLSIYYNDLSTSANYGLDNQYLLLGTDFKFSLFSADIDIAYLMATGKLNGAAREGNGVSGQVVIPYFSDLLFGLNSSYYSINNVNDYRHIFSMTYLINRDMTLKTEYYIDRVNGQNDWKGQVQLLVSI